jgi:hypothetical protein
MRSACAKGCIAAERSGARKYANEATGANAGGPRWSTTRTRWAARIAQFRR